MNACFPASFTTAHRPSAKRVALVKGCSCVAGSVRGRTTTREERRLASDLERRLREEGLEARVEAVATKPGAVSKLRIEVPADALAVLRAALRGA